MDLFMYGLFFVMFLILVCVLVYLIYDYIYYKNEVDKSIETTTAYVNTSFDKMSQNIDITEQNFNSNLNLTNTDVRSLKLSGDVLNNNINSMNDVLNKYFQFKPYTDKGIPDDKIYNHIISSVNPNLDLISKVNAVNGITIQTPNDLVNDKNIKICNATSNCVDLNVNNDGFNITPTNTNKLTINSVDKTPLAYFDLQKKAVYFGGKDTNAPMFVQENDLYVNNINMIVKKPGTVYTDNNVNSLNLIRISGNDLYTAGEKLNAYNSNIFNNLSNSKLFLTSNYDFFGKAITNLQEVFGNMLDNTNEVLLFYELNNVYDTLQMGKVTNTFNFKMTTGKDIFKDDLITFNISYIEVSLMQLTNPYSFKNPSDEENIDITGSTIKDNTSFATITIKIAKNIPKYSSTFWSFEGTNIIVNPLTRLKTGVFIGSMSRPFVVDTPITNAKTAYDKVSNFLNSGLI